MASKTVVIFAEAGGWRIGTATRGGVSVTDVPVPPDATPVSRTEALAKALAEMRIPPGTLAVLALESRACLCAAVATSGLPARQREKALLYRFEEKLPVSAEEVSADFVLAGDDTALAVAVERRVLDPLAGALASAGVRGVAVCPASLLALQQWTAGRPASLVPPTDDAFELVLWPAGAEGAELFVLRGGMPAAWYVTSNDPDDVALHVRMARLNAPGAGRVLVCGMASDVTGRLDSLGVPVVSVERVDRDALATAAGQELLKGKRRPWVDLAGGGAGGPSGRPRANRTAASSAAAAAFTCLAAVAVALFWRAARYEHRAAGYEAEAVAVFRDALPGQPVPLDVRSRLASEAQQVSRPGAAGRHDAAAAGQGLVVLRDVLTFLPADVRFRLSEVQLIDGGFTLEGEARSHGDAEALAAALRRRAGFAVDAPRTEQRPGRVGFTITGTAASPAADRVGFERRAAR